MVIHIEPDKVMYLHAHMSSPSHVAATIGSVQCLQTLQAYGASLSLKSKYGATPLHEAAANGNAGGCSYRVLWYKTACVHIHVHVHVYYSDTLKCTHPTLYMCMYVNYIISYSLKLIFEG